MRVLVAGATGVLGAGVTSRLVDLGHQVIGLSRSGRPVPGVDMVSCDVFDTNEVVSVMNEKSPDVVVHILTRLPKSLLQADAADVFAENDRIRDKGTQNLVRACLQAGVARIVAQSIAFGYAPEGPMVVDESAPLWIDAPEPWGASVRAVARLEDEVLESGLEAVVLRYGALYGPGTWWGPTGDLTEFVRGGTMPLVDQGNGVTSFVHVEDAAAAAVVAASGSATGVFNVVDDDPAPASDWLPALASSLGAPDPSRITMREARESLDSQTIHRQTEQRGADNTQARTVLGWTPEYPSWRDQLGR